MRSLQSIAVVLTAISHMEGLALKLLGTQLLAIASELIAASSLCLRHGGLLAWVHLRMALTLQIL